MSTNLQSLVVNDVVQVLINPPYAELCGDLRTIRRKADELTVRRIFTVNVIFADHLAPVLRAHLAGKKATYLLADYASLSNQSLRSFLLRVQKVNISLWQFEGGLCITNSYQWMSEECMCGREWAFIDKEGVAEMLRSIQED